MRTTAARIGLTLIATTTPPDRAEAQSIGTFAWRLEPFCNVVRFAISADGPAYRLTGVDDACGTTPVPAAGVVTPSPDGTYTLAFYLITPQGQGHHTTATIAPSTLGGPWRDDGGLSGMLTFGPPGGTGGGPRPAVQLQRRVAGVCSGSQFVQKVREDGSVDCGTAAGTGSGDITGVKAGTGLTGGGTSGDVVLGIAPSGVGAAEIANGSVGLAEINPTQVQRRVANACATGLFVTGIGADGAAVCTGGTSITSNTAVGNRALANTPTGGQNTALGSLALEANSTGSYNVALGYSALAKSSGRGNVAVGAFALDDLTTGWDNIAIGGGGNLSSGDRNIYIGNDGSGDESDTIRIGWLQSRALIRGIRGVTTANNNAVAVLIDSAGQLGTISSSRRSKDDIQDMGEASAGLQRLRPVTFRYVQPYADGSTPRDYGLIAEEVDEVYPDLVVRNEAGEVETVQYHKLVPMLLNELQRQQRDFEQVRARLAEIERSRR